MTDIRWIECDHGLSVGLEPGIPPVDEEGRHCCEPIGYSFFAWLPVKCRNGKIRWLTAVERHVDGTYTLGRFQ